MLVTPKKNKNLDIDIDKIRRDFPILKIKSNNKPLIFFDNGASSQKPTAVINKIKEIYETKYANIHRWQQSGNFCHFHNQNCHMHPYRTHT